MLPLTHARPAGKGWHLMRVGAMASFVLAGLLMVSTLSGALVGKAPKDVDRSLTGQSFTGQSLSGQSLSGKFPMFAGDASAGNAGAD